MADEPLNALWLVVHSRRGFVRQAKFSALLIFCVVADCFVSVTRSILVRRSRRLLISLVPKQIPDFLMLLGTKPHCLVN